MVLTGTYPGAATMPDNFAQDLGDRLVLSLNHLGAADTTRLLDTLAKQLVQGDLASRDIHSAEFWSVLRNALESGDPLLGRVSATFQTRFFSTAIARPAQALTFPAHASGPDVPSPPAVPSGATFTAEKSDGTRARLTAMVRRGTGLLLDPARNSYVGTFSVALQNLDFKEDDSTLKEPTDVAIGSGGAYSYAPRPVRVTRLLAWNQVEIVTPSPSGSKFPVSVSAQLGDPGNSVDLDVIRPQVGLSAVSPSILGWGLGTTKITVTAPVYAGKSLNLTAAGGALDSGTVPIDKNGNGVATLRSDVSPSGTVSLAPMQGEANPVTISFRPPYIFLLAAILGGLLGAFLRGKGRKKWERALAIGVGSAVLMTVGYAVGFTSFMTTALGPSSLATSGEAVVFFLGAIAALIGVTVLIPGLAQRRAP